MARKPDKPDKPQRSYSGVRCEPASVAEFIEAQQWALD